MSEPIQQIDQIGPLVFQPPSANAPGYLKRQRRAAEFLSAQREHRLSPEAWDALVEFLLDFVIEPTDRTQARASLWDCTETQFDEMLDAINGKKAAPPLVSSAS